MNTDRSITYVTSRWGEPTQTFVRREAEAVKDLGVAVRALSLKKPVPLDAGVAGATVPVIWLSPIRVAWGVVVALLTRPVSTCRALGAVVSNSARRNLLRTLAATCVGLAWATSGAAGTGCLHSHFGWVSGTATWAAAGLGGNRYSIVLHAFELHTAKLCDGFTRLPIEGADEVFCISERDTELVRRMWGVEASVLRMGVPSAWLENRATQVPPTPWNLVSVGSLTDKKGHDILLSALAEADPRWRLTIIGEGPRRQLLEAMVDTLGLTGRVSMPGLLDEEQVRAHLDASWAFALACRVTAEGDRDGIPVALMEAMARGLPVVTTTAGAIPELVEGVGMMVTSGDTAALAAAIDSLRPEPGQRRAPGAEAGRERIRGEFTCESGARRVAGLPERTCSDGYRNGGDPTGQGLRLLAGSDARGSTGAT